MLLWLATPCGELNRASCKLPSWKPFSFPPIMVWKQKPEQVFTAEAANSITSLCWRPLAMFGVFEINTQKMPREILLSQRNWLQNIYGYNWLEALWNTTVDLFLAFQRMSVLFFFMCIGDKKQIKNTRNNKIKQQQNEKRNKTQWINFKMMQMNSRSLIKLSSLFRITIKMTGILNEPSTSILN